jgi:predicted GNAT family N-acyltransferase
MPSPDELRTIRTSYADARADIRSVRDDVFIREQSVPPEIELDDRDEVCRHVVVYRGNTPVGTGRIDLERDGKLGRIAVVASERRSGIGSKVMIELEAIAREEGLDRIFLYGQIAAAGFYGAVGFAAEGEPFDIADIPHKKMVKRL